MQHISLCYGIGTTLSIFLRGFRPFIGSTASTVLHSKDAAPGLMDTRFVAVARDSSPRKFHSF